MRSELIEAINIQAKRDGIYNPIIKAVVFEELSRRYKSIPLKKLLISSRGGSWGEDDIIGGIQAISLRSPDIRNGFIDFKNGKKRFYDITKFEKFRLEDGDILVIKSNGSLDLVGKSQVYFSSNSYPNVTASNFLMILRPNQKLVSSLYLDSFLKSPQSLIWRVEKQRTTTGLRNLDTKGYLSLEVPLPESIVDQNKIFEIVSELMEHKFPENDYLNISKIELASKLSKRFKKLLKKLECDKAKITQLKQSILQEAIQGKLTAGWRKEHPELITGENSAEKLLQKIKAEKAQLIKEKKIQKEKALPDITEDEIPFKLPEGWVWCRLGEVLLYSDAGKSPNCKKIAVSNDEWGVLTTTSIQNGLFQDHKNKLLPKNFKINKNQTVESGDILITRAGPLNRTGVSCVVKSIKFNLILSDKTIRLNHPKELMSPEFISMALNTKIIRKILIPKMTGMAESQVNISQKNIKISEFPLPPSSEQKVIVEKVESLLKKCMGIKLEIEKSEQHAKVLLQAVLKEAFENGPKEKEALEA